MRITRINFIYPEKIKKKKNVSIFSRLIFESSNKRSRFFFFKFKNEIKKALLESCT